MMSSSFVIRVAFEYVRTRGPAAKGRMRSFVGRGLMAVAPANRGQQSSRMSGGDLCDKVAALSENGWRRHVRMYGGGDENIQLGAVAGFWLFSDQGAEFVVQVKVPP